MIKNPTSGQEIAPYIQIDRSKIGRADARYGESRIIPALSRIPYARLDLLTDVAGEQYIPNQSSRMYVIHPSGGFVIGMNSRRRYHPLDNKTMHWFASEYPVSVDAVAEAVHGLAYPSQYESQADAFRIIGYEMAIKFVTRTALDNPSTELS